jgi:hypothetical protein
MTDNALSIRIVREEGPVIIPSLQGEGIDAKYGLWEDVTAAEFFPPKVDSAFYILSLSKFVSQHTEVSKVKAELVGALKLIAIAWPFCGGSFMIPETYQVLKISSYESNSGAIEKELLAREGFQRVANEAAANLEVLAMYLRPPLGTATQLANAMHCEPALAKLLEYHQQAWVEYYYHDRSLRSSWFTHLYKVRDFLVKVCGGEKEARLYLNISKADWSFFGKILNGNNLLRHAEIQGMSPTVARADVDRLFLLARGWIRSYLKEKGLPFTTF